jgi:branched-chain amino acid transport system substrate-binding protein
MAKRTKGLLAATLVAAVAAAIVASTASTRPTAQGPIKIGISLSLTGDFSDPGKAVKRGYDLWAAYVNAHGGILGRQVQLKIVNDASDPNQAVSN